MRQVRANDNSGFWEVFIDDMLLAEFDSESDALEFAAAPEMLAALKQVDELFTKYIVIGKHVDKAQETHETVRDVIAKAEGRQQ